MQVTDEQTRFAASAALEVLSGAKADRILQLVSELTIAKAMLGMVSRGQCKIVDVSQLMQGTGDSPFPPKPSPEPPPSPPRRKTSKKGSK